jgi:hypothetical protein
LKASERHKISSHETRLVLREFINITLLRQVKQENVFQVGGGRFISFDAKDRGISDEFLEYDADKQGDIDLYNSHTEL